MSQGPPAWESDFEVALRFFRRRWWDEVDDLLDATTPEVLAFDDLDLDVDLDELGRAIGLEKLVRLARRGLEATAPEDAMDPAVRALDATDLPRARAFLRLISANLAFALRTDELLDSLVASKLPPRIAPPKLGALLARARSARVARTFLEKIPAEEPRREALASVAPSAREGTWRCVHVRSSPEAVGEGLARVLARRGLAPARWTERHAKEPLERFAVTRPRGGWVTLLAPGGVERALAVELAGAAPSLSRVVWVERTGETARFALLEGSRLVDDEAKLAARQGGALELDDVTGALRALGIVAHDLGAPGKDVPLAFEEVAAAPESNVRLTRAVGYAFLPKAEVERLDRAAGKRLYVEREKAKKKNKKRPD